MPQLESANINIHSTNGDSHLVRDKNDIRIFYETVKGLTYSHTGEDCNYYLMNTQTIGADIIGMAETNTAWQHHHLQASLTSQAQNILAPQTFHLVNQMPPLTRFQTKKPSNLEDPSPWQLGALYQCHTGDILRTQLVWDAGVDTSFKESQMHSYPSSLHTELVQDPLGLAAHSVVNTNTSVDHNNLFPQDHKNNWFKTLLQQSKLFKPLGTQFPLWWTPTPTFMKTKTYNDSRPMRDVHNRQPGPFYLHWFRSPMHWPHVWMFAALKVGHMLGFLIISGWTTVQP